MKRENVEKGAIGALAASAAAGIGLAARRLRQTQDEEDSGPSRNYCFEAGQRLDEEARRVAHGRIDRALEQLAGANEGNLAEGIHEARKDLKKLRSLIRLLRPALGDETYRRENGRYRDIGRGLSSLRDAEARVEAFEGLVEWAAGENGKPGFGDFREQLVAERDRAAGDTEVLSDAIGGARAALREGREAVAVWSLPAKEGEALTVLREGLRRAYRRGRNRLADAESDPTHEALHEWRKRVKDLWYQLDLLADSWRPVLDPLAEEAHELSTLLGDEHDLLLLREAVEEHDDAFAQGEREQFEKTIDRRSKELQREAFALGRRLYAEPPKAFAGRIVGYRAALPLEGRR